MYDSIKILLLRNKYFQPILIVRITTICHMFMGHMMMIMMIMMTIIMIMMIIMMRMMINCTSVPFIASHFEILHLI